MTQRHTSPVIACSIYLLLHLAADVSASLFQVAPEISIWYPPAGFALSLLLLLGVRFAPVVFFANVLSAVLFSHFKVWWAPIVFPFLITATYTGTAWVLRRSTGTSLMPDSRKRAFVFSAMIVGAPAVLAIVGTGVLILLNKASPANFIYSALRWWVGDVSGLLTVVPVALVFAGPRLVANTPLPRVPWLRSLRDVGLFGLEMLTLLGCLALVFEVSPLKEYNAFYLCFLPLIWICIRHGLPGATLATLLIAMGGMIGMHVTGTNSYFIINFLLFQLAVAVVGLGLGTAVTRRSETEQELATSESRFERVIDGAQLGLWDWNVASDRISFNSRWNLLAGLTSGGHSFDFASWENLVHPADRRHFSHALRDHLEGRTPLIEVSYRIRTRDHVVRWMFARGSTMARDAQGRPLLVSGTHTDITDTKHAEAETQRLLNILEANTDFIATAKADGTILYANASLLELLGTRNFFGCKLSDLFTDRAAKTFETEAIPTAVDSGFWHGELAVVGRNRTEIHVSAVLLPDRDEETEALTFSLILRDISRLRQAETERIEGERKMLQVQKLESLGVLAGGIAHDFNNLLTAIMGNASLARIGLADDTPTATALVQIENASERAAELCQQMLAYAGRSPLAFATVDLSSLIEETTKLIQVSLRKNTTLDLRLTRPVAPIKADASQLRQIVMNLVLNASEAIGDLPGRILVHTETRHFGIGELRASFDNQELTPGDYVLLEIEDNGSGMTHETRQHIFEPFFTTKFTGRGLGLAAVLGIVKAHRGAIQVASEPSQGTVFRIIFPVTSFFPLSPLVKPKPSAAISNPGLVLVIDDEDGVRTVLSRTLEKLGFKVVTASNGSEGVDYVRKNGAALHFILLDLVMPLLDGHEAFLQMQLIAPSVPVILMSGFSEKLSLERFGGLKPAAFISKPFARDALLRCLTRVGLAQKV